MVTTVMNTAKPSVLNLTAEEIEEIHANIEQGLLPKNWLDLCDEARAANVFGIGFKTDRHGNPIEQGLGSDSQMTANSIAAYRKYGVNEPDYDRHLARMEKLFAEQQAQRRKAAAR